MRAGCGKKPLAIALSMSKGTRRRALWLWSLYLFVTRVLLNYYPLTIDWDCRLSLRASINRARKAAAAINNSLRLLGVRGPAAGISVSVSTAILGFPGS